VAASSGVGHPGAVRDGLEAREELASLCALATPELATLQLMRFRRATLGSTLAEVTSSIADGVLGGEGEGAPRELPRGLAIVARREDGAPLWEVRVHPAAEDLEAFAAGVAIETARRTGCAVELWADDVPLERFTPRSGREGAYREAPEDLAAHFAGLDVEVRREGEKIGLVHRTKVRPQPVAILVVAVVAFFLWWAALIALLFRAGRRFVFDVLRAALRMTPVRWEAELEPRRLVIRAEDTEAVTVALDRVRWVSLAPPAWARDEREQPPVLRALLDGRLVELEVPRALRAPLAEALRRIVV
jgi:hypothetical protein